ncbi:hypothetical protein SGI37_20070, partial [Providencia rettgeri]
MEQTQPSLQSLSTLQYLKQVIMSPTGSNFCFIISISTGNSRVAITCVFGDHEKLTVVITTRAITKNDSLRRGRPVSAMLKIYKLGLHL